jgi:hypothetical protein
MFALSRPVGDPATDALRLLQRLGLFLLLVAVPTAGLLSRRALYILLPVGCALLVIGGVLQGVRRPRVLIRRASTSKLVAVALFVCGWSVLSLVWTPFLGAASDRTIKALATLFLLGATLAVLPRRTPSLELAFLPIGVALCALATLGSALLGPARLALATGPDLAPLQRGAVATVVLVWPALAVLALGERWILAGLLATGAAGTAIIARDEATLAAMAFGALVFAAAMTAPRRTARLVGVVSIGLVLVGPIVPLLLNLVLSAIGLDIPPIADWAALVSEAPLRLLTGHGIDFTEAGLRTGYLPYTLPRTALAEIWFDFGVLGALGVSALIWIAAVLAARTRFLIAPGLLGGLAACITLALAGFQTTQIWWLNLLVVAIVACAIAARAARAQRRRLDDEEDEDDAPEAF